jgi:hypothetical protein
MRETYKDGLVVIAVNVDQASEKDKHARAHKWVTEKLKGKMTHVNLGTTPNWASLAKTSEALPTFFVFNQEGKYVVKEPAAAKGGGFEDPDKKALDKAVKELLKK